MRKFSPIIIAVTFLFILSACGGVSQEVHSTLQSDYEALEQEYVAYKEKMAPYEALEKAEAEARLLEAEKAAAEKAAKEKAAAEVAEKAKMEEEKKGYETGITYSQLARTPDDYILKKVKFKGKILQVMEGDSENQMRLAVNSNYDTVLYVAYNKNLLKTRLLEDDIVTIYGYSVGTISYQSTMGGTITIPGVSAKKIDIHN